MAEITNEPSMIERVAAALVAAGVDQGNFSRAGLVELSRAAIAAMREPTEAMLEQYYVGITGSTMDGTDSIDPMASWLAIIDEALR